MGGHDQVSESQVDANKVEARIKSPVRNQEDRGSKERASDACSSYRYINKKDLKDLLDLELSIIATFLEIFEDK